MSLGMSFSWESGASSSAIIRTLARGSVLFWIERAPPFHNLSNGRQKRNVDSVLKMNQKVLILSFEFYITVSGRVRSLNQTSPGENLDTPALLLERIESGTEERQRASHVLHGRGSSISIVGAHNCCVT